MAVVKVDTLADFEKQLTDAGGKAVFVDFTAVWCGPCQMIGPKFVELAAQNPEAVFLKVDVDENDETAAKYEIRAMPTFKVFKGGKEVAEMVGASEDKLRNLVKEHK